MAAPHLSPAKSSCGGNREDPGGGSEDSMPDGLCIVPEGEYIISHLQVEDMVKIAHQSHK
jgi:hypothetical protein